MWDKIGGNFNDAAKSLSKGLDGHYYLVPLYNYPWVVFYNKSVFAAKGYTVPTTWDDFIALAKKMKTDGLCRSAFADKDGWPALGTFDIINLRINGYDYHIKLMKHEVPWTDPGVTAVFDQWRELMPYLQNGANGRIWQDAAKALENKQAGMMFQGTNQVAANYVTDGRTCPTWTSSRSRRSTRRTARTTWTPRPTASCCRRREEQGRGQDSARVHRHRRRRGRATSRPTTGTSAWPTASSRRPTTTSRRSPSPRSPSEERRAVHGPRHRAGHGDRR